MSFFWQVKGFCISCCPCLSFDGLININFYFCLFSKSHHSSLLKKCALHIWKYQIILSSPNNLSFLVLALLVPFILQRFLEEHHHNKIFNVEVRFWWRLLWLNAHNFWIITCCNEIVLVTTFWSLCGLIFHELNWFV